MSSPSKRPLYPSVLSRTDNDWATNNDDDDYDAEDQYEYEDNDDEDEFGLPSLSNTRKSAKRIPNNKFNNDPGGSRSKAGNNLFPLSVNSSGNRARANSADIAEERGPPSYPSAKKSEGKILRPQYKDILRGMLSV